MINEDILGGLKSALERGQSLKSAMISFFNSGYNKAEIEEAASSLLKSMKEPSISLEPAEPISKKEFKQIPKPYSHKDNLSEIAPKEISKLLKPIPEETISAKVIQKVSAYGEKEPKEKIVVIMLIVLLIVLLGILGAIFLFKNQLISFFTDLFS